MLRYLSPLLLFLGALPAASQDPAKPTVTWHGQSFFEVRSSKGTNIVLDPHNIQEYLRILGVKADAILLSHFHNDHTQVDVVENFKEAKIIRGLSGKGNKTSWNKIDEKVKDISIRSVGTYHDDMEGLNKGRNTVFCLEVDGWKIVHLGDLGHTLSEEQVKQIGDIDVLLIPVGGIYTLNGADAIKVVNQLKVKEYIIPMHYGTPAFDDLLSAAEFLEGMPKDKILRSKDNALVLERDVNRQGPQVQVLHYWPQMKKKEKEKEKEKDK